MHCTLTLNTPPPQKDILRIQSSTPRSTVLAIKQYYIESPTMLTPHHTTTTI